MAQPFPTAVPVSDAAAAASAGGAHDAVVLVAPDPKAATADLAPCREAIEAAAGVDARFASGVSLLAAVSVAGGRLVVAPTGPLTRDQDDVRRFATAAAQGMRRARDAGARSPLLVIAGIPNDARFAHAVEVAGLGALGALWEPLEAREALGQQECEPIESVGIAVAGGKVSAETARWITAVEAGRRLSRDLGGTEPERMAPLRFAEYCEEAFAGSAVKVSILRDPAVFLRDYPLAAAVARASMPVPRHHPCIVRLEYEGEGPITKTVFLAGKGVTYDTGGADIKAGGIMAGMSRDKGGAASVAGLMHAIGSLQPAGVRVVAELGMVRNSIGAECFVSDEIIKSHAGVRVRIGNTDAEGRLVLADLLSHLREEAQTAKNPCVLSVATLTGHSARAVGPYNIALDNGPARAAGIAEALSAAGDAWGDPFDVSRLRPEDFDFVAPKTRADDVFSCNSAPSTATARGHQFPMAFLAIASGLDRHGRDGEPPIPFTHCDIGGSYCENMDWQHGRPTGRPVVGLLTGLLGGDA